MEINLMDTKEYTQVKRDIAKRLAEKTPEMIDICKKFDWEYFDRKGYCYNGYIYDGRWVPIAKRFINHYLLNPGARVLDMVVQKDILYIT